MAADSPLDASFVIATKDRPDDLRRTLRSIEAQDANVEVIVMDDASAPGTLGGIEREFPGVTVRRGERSEGSIARRNAGMRLARADIVFLIDDDVELASPSIVRDTVRDFDDSRVAIVAMPLREPRKGDAVAQRAPSPDGVFVTHAYIGAGSAFRRDVFNDAGGYWRALFHRHEEGELALRLLDRGYVVRLGRADPTLHFESTRRASAWMLRSWGRNELLVAWRDVPMPYLVGRVAKIFGNVLLHVRRQSEARDLLVGLALGVRDAARLRGERRPVRRSTYAVSRRLRHGGPQPIERIAAALPPAGTVRA